jgi:hypothetical protein
MLPSVINGAQRCVSFTKRTKLLCKNPAAYGCKVCRYHGAHKSRNVTQGENHHNYTHGNHTKKAKIDNAIEMTRLRTLISLGKRINLFS